MSLDKVLLGIVEDLEKDAEEVHDGELEIRSRDLKAYAKRIRDVAKMSEAETPKAKHRLPSCARCYKQTEKLSDLRLCDACDGDRVQREERIKNQNNAEETHMGSTAIILDGPLFQENQTTTIPLPDGMPVNAYMPIQDFWYQLKTTGLRHAPHKEEEAKRAAAVPNGGILLGKG